MAEELLKDDGGWAFPTPFSGGTATEEGMTLRDWFAGQALVGIAGPAGGDGFSLSPGDSADWAYQYADAMLAERSKE